MTNGAPMESIRLSVRVLADSGVNVSASMTGSSASAPLVSSSTSASGAGETAGPSGMYMRPCASELSRKSCSRLLDVHASFGFSGVADASFGFSGVADDAFCLGFTKRVRSSSIGRTSQRGYDSHMSCIM